MIECDEYDGGDENEIEDEQLPIHSFQCHPLLSVEQWITLYLCEDSVKNDKVLA